MPLFGHPLGHLTGPQFLSSEEKRMSSVSVIPSNQVISLFGTLLSEVFSQSLLSSTSRLYLLRFHREAQRVPKHLGLHHSVVSYPTYNDKKVKFSVSAYNFLPDQNVPHRPNPTGLFLPTWESWHKIATNILEIRLPHHHWISTGKQAAVPVDYWDLNRKRGSSSNIKNVKNTSHCRRFGDLVCAPKCPW